MKRFRPHKSSSRIISRLAVLTVVAGTSGIIGMQLLFQSSAAPVPGPDDAKNTIYLENNPSNNAVTETSQTASTRAIAISLISLAATSVVLGALSAYKQYRLTDKP